MRILLIEDDRKIAAAISKSLRAEGYAVDVAHDGIEGEELALVNDNDLIILDVMLPRQDGWKTCSNLRRQKILIPILILTALEDVNNRIKGLDGGADDYLSKPFHFGELLALLPLAMGLGAGSQMQQPLAIAVIGGFSLSSLLLLFALPMAYRLMK